MWSTVNPRLLWENGINAEVPVNAEERHYAPALLVPLCRAVKAISYSRKNLPHNEVNPSAVSVSELTVGDAGFTHVIWRMTGL